MYVCPPTYLIGPFACNFDILKDYSPMLYHMFAPHILGRYLGNFLPTIMMYVSLSVHYYLRILDTCILFLIFLMPLSLCGVSHSVVVSALHSGWENPSSSLPIHIALG